MYARAFPSTPGCCLVRGLLLGCFQPNEFVQRDRFDEGWRRAAAVTTGVCFSAALSSLLQHGFPKGASTLHRETLWKMAPLHFNAFWAAVSLHRHLAVVLLGFVPQSRCGNWSSPSSGGFSVEDSCYKSWERGQRAPLHVTFSLVARYPHIPFFFGLLSMRR